LQKFQLLNADRSVKYFFRQIAIFAELFKKASGHSQ